MLTKRALVSEYINKKQSVSVIANKLNCSESKVNYWLKKYSIEKRSISEAIYLKENPQGDPFFIKQPKGNDSWFLCALGLGLYWGEGNKKNRHAVRLGNTDPDLVWYFLRFLVEICGVDKKRLRFGLQIFADLDEKSSRLYWCEKLGVQPSQFHKTSIVSNIKRGTYTRKCRYGVVTVYFSNVKLRDTIMTAIDRLRERRSSFTSPM